MDDYCTRIVINVDVVYELLVNHDGASGMGYNGVTVLVVEDEILVRMDIAQSLEDDGFHVLETSNADDVMVLLDAHSDSVRARGVVSGGASSGNG